MTVDFTKAEGSQNDFVIIDDRLGAIDERTRRGLTTTMCHRRKGVGADGTIFIDASDGYDFKMSFFNPDGSTGSMCGNGGRCAALYAFTHGIAPKEMRFEVLGITYSALVEGNMVRLYFPAPSDITLNTTVAVDGRKLPCHYAHTGAPHVVVFAEDLGIQSLEALHALDVDTLGREVRNAGVYSPGGVNANFVFADTDGVLHIRTFEKGVEAETEACGTGTIASAILAHLKKGLAPPLKLVTRNGDVLRVGFTLPAPDATRRFTDGSAFADGLYFEGQTNLVFEGAFTHKKDA